MIPVRDAIEKTAQFEPERASDTIFDGFMSVSPVPLSRGGERGNVRAYLCSQRCRAHRITRADHPSSPETENAPVGSLHTPTPTHIHKLYPSSLPNCAHGNNIAKALAAARRYTGAAAAHPVRLSHERGSPRHSVTCAN